MITSTAEAKALVDERMAQIRADGWAINLNDINQCINELRQRGFIVVVDGTMQAINNVMTDGRGNVSFA